MAIELLIDCINQFARQQTNPVLSVIPSDGNIQQNRRYPEPVLQFENAGLRSYYHCHDMKKKPQDEHGHFHIFIQIQPDTWSHLAGLSMDNFGQPLQWFTVNQWVSGESWGEQKSLFDALDLLHINPESSLIERWLAAMLSVYQQTLKNLIHARNSTLNKLMTSDPLSKVLQDRTHYILSACDIDFFNDIKQFSETNNYLT